MLKKISFLILILLLSILGMLLSFTLSEEYYFKSVSPEPGKEIAIFSKVSSKVCGETSSVMDCSTIVESQYAVFYGIPVAILGMLFYAGIFILCLCLVFSREKLKPAVIVAFFWANLTGVVIDIALFLICLLIIEVFCPLCLITYVFSILLLAIAIFLLRENKINPLRLINTFKTIFMPGGRSSLTKNIAAVLAILIIPTCIAFGTDKYLKTTLENYQALEDEKMVEKIIQRFSKRKKTDIRPSEMMIVGNRQAPIEIVEFSDFLCPHCSKAAKLLDEIVHDNPDKVKVIFVNYPLDTACNRYMKKPMHQGACLLAMAAICASEQELFEEYQKTVFSMKLKRAGLKQIYEIARLSGLETMQFQTCMETPNTQHELSREINEARKYGVKSTPTIFINKKRYKGKRRKDILQRIIDMESTPQHFVD